jgi:hypothetical protein
MQTGGSHINQTLDILARHAVGLFSCIKAKITLNKKDARNVIWIHTVEKVN